jgi:hypothetical protein
VSTSKTTKAAVAKIIKTAFTLVTSSGVTFTVASDGTFIGGAGKPLSKGLSTRIATGSLLVTTPHQASGAYGERQAGGIYAAIKSSAKLRTIRDQIANDPRGSAQQKADALAAIDSLYSQATN